MNCKYCEEKMSFGLQSKTVTETKIENNVKYYRKIEYKQFGWTCNLTNKKCDIILDDKKTDVNVHKLKDALIAITLLKWTKY